MLNFKKYETYTVSFDEDRKAWNEEDRLLRAQFKADALATFGLTNHWRADQIFEFAWENAHSGGYRDVFNFLEEMAAAWMGR